MHVHLPKPLHGWREFFGEVGIIVVGVLIALTAEQLVETWHWHHEVETERDSLLQEASDSFDGVVTRKGQQSCIDTRLDELHTIFERHAHGQPLGIVGKVGLPAHQSATRGTWQIALSGQALSHMSQQEKLDFSDVFASFDLWDGALETEGDAWSRLTPLNDPDLLSDQDWSGLKVAYGQAMLVNARIRLLGPWMLDKRLPGIEKYRGAGNLTTFSRLRDAICHPLLQASGKVG